MMAFRKVVNNNKISQDQTESKHKGNVWLNLVAVTSPCIQNEWKSIYFTFDLVRFVIVVNFYKCHPQITMLIWVQMYVEYI